VLVSDRLKRVIAVHRSDTNNTASLARRGLVARLAAIGLELPVDVAPQNVPLDCEPPQGTLFAG